MRTTAPHRVPRSLALLLVLACGLGAQESFVGQGADLLPDPPAAVGRLGLELVTFVPGGVLDVTWAPDGSDRLFLVNPDGDIRIFANGTLLPTPFLSAPASPPGRGMTSLAFHPDYATNGLCYVVTGEALPNASTPHFVPPQDLTPAAFDAVLVEYRVQAGDPDRLDPASRRELLRVRQAHPTHSMNDIVFGHDGYLYVSLGDGGPTRMGTPTIYAVNGQDTTNPYGSVLRIDVDQVGRNGRYAIPPDNPFAAGTGGNLPEIWCWGIRNAWRLGVDRLTGAIYAGENGDFTIEEVLRLEGGGNYGWAVKEGSFLWDPITGNAAPDPAPDPAYTPPLAEWDHNHTTRAHGSTIGGNVYRGQAIPWLRGKYLCFDYVAGRFLTVDPATGQLQWVPQDERAILLSPYEDVSMGEDADGELYVTRLNGLVFRVIDRPRRVQTPFATLQAR